MRLKFEQAQVLLVNFLADDYRFFLKKLLGLISLFPPTLKALVVPLPSGCRYVNMFYAKRIQQVVAAASEGSFVVLFIAHEAHKQLLRNFYKVEKDTVKPLSTVVNMTASMSEGTLLYSWGSAAFGKLGIGVSSEADCDAASEFVREDLGRIKLNKDDPEYSFFSISPQPIVSFLGTKVK